MLQNILEYFPHLFGALGFSVRGTKILKIHVCLFNAASWIGVVPLLFALGLSDKGAKILTISVCPHLAAKWIGVYPELFEALGLSVKGAKILTISVCYLDDFSKN